MYSITKSKFYLPTDDSGYIINVSSIDYLSTENSNYVQSIVNYFLLLHRSHVHSIYLSGSSSNGRFREGYSDIDLLVVYKEDVQFDKKLKGRISEIFCLENPRLPQIDLSQRKFKDVFNGPINFLIKTQMCCVYGDNIQQLIKPFRITEAIIYNLPLSKKLFDTFHKKIVAETNPEIIKLLGMQLFKNIIRFSYETILLDTKKYTRDLFTCYSELATFYPNKATLFKKILEHSINGISNKGEILKLADEIKDWLVDKSDEFQKNRNSA